MRFCIIGMEGFTVFYKKRLTILEIYDKLETSKSA